MKGLRIIWTITLVCAFFGTFLFLECCPSLFAYRIMLVIHLSLFIPVFLLKREKMKYRFAAAEYPVFFIIWFSWALVTLIWAPSKLYALKHLCFLFSGFSLVLFTVYYFRESRSLKILFSINLAVLVLFIVQGLGENITGLHIAGGFPHYYLKENSLPLTGVFGHPNNFATYVATYLPLFYVEAKYNKHIWVKLLCFAGILVGVHLIIYSGSRANMLALLIGLVFLVMLNIVNIVKTVKRVKKPAGFFKKLIVIFAIFFLMFSVVMLTPPLTEFVKGENNYFVEQVNSVFKNWTQDGSIQTRLLLINKGIEMLRKYHWLGVGPGNVEFLMEQYREETYGNVKVHNWWVEIMVNYGIIVLALYLVFYIKMLWDLFFIFYRTNCIWWKKFSECMFLSLLVFSVGVISNGSIIAASHMWIMYGLAVCTINSFRENKNFPVRKEC